MNTTNDSAGPSITWTPSEHNPGWFNGEFVNCQEYPHSRVAAAARVSWTPEKDLYVSGKFTLSITGVDLGTEDPPPLAVVFPILSAAIIAYEQGLHAGRGALEAQLKSAIKTVKSLFTP